VQSNHARATAAVAARAGVACVLVVNGRPSDKPTANALLDRLLGAEIRYVESRSDRAPMMEEVARDLRERGRRPFIIPLGASTAYGAAAYALAVGELLSQMDAPDVIVTATSSGGTQAGLITGCRLNGLATRVLGISADDPAETIREQIRGILHDLESLLDIASGTLDRMRIDIDDRFVGAGYGIATPESSEALHLCARSEALFLDPTYTAKAMAGIISRIRGHELQSGRAVFWHTGGQVALFA
jgi:L-cysteate sulfo-lyase